MLSVVLYGQHYKMMLEPDLQFQISESSFTPVLAVIQIDNESRYSVPATVHQVRLDCVIMPCKLLAYKGVFFGSGCLN